MIHRLFGGLRSILVILLLSAIVPLLGLTIYSRLQNLQISATTAQRDALNLARLAAADQDLLIESTYQLLSDLAGRPEVRRGERAPCSALLAEKITQFPRYANLLVTDPAGIPWCSAVPFTGTASYADRAWFLEVLRTRTFVVGGYALGRVTQRPLATFAYPALDSAGEVQAIVAAGMDLAWLNQFITQMTLPPGSVLTVIDSSGVVLARTLEPEAWVGQTMSEAPLIEAILAQPERGTLESTGLDGVRRLYAFTSLGSQAQDGGVYVIVGIPAAVAYAEADRLLRHNLIILLFITLVELVVVWLGAEAFLIRPINTLLRTTRRLAAGDLTARTGSMGGARELGQLATAFDRMAANLDQHFRQRQEIHAALRASEERFRALAENAQDLVSILDADGCYCFASYSHERVLGYAPAELVGRSVFELLHPDDLPAIVQTVSVGLREAGAVRTAVFRCRHRDGSWRTLESIGMNLLHLPAVRGLVVNSRDVSERVQAETALRKSEERYRQTLDHMMEGCQIIGFDWRYLYVNDAVAAQGRKSRDELIGRTMMEVYPGIEQTEVFDVLRRSMVEPIPQRIESEFTYEDGTTGWFDLSIQPAPEGIFILSNDISGRKREAKLRLAHAVAERASQAKSEFLSRMSHELRTPLNAILGFAQLLQMDELPSQQARSVAQILKSGRHLLDLINEVLDIARIEAGRMSISLEAVQIESAIQEVFDLIRPQAAARKISLSCEIPSSTDVFALADRQRLRQVLLNLLVNAVKYNREGGEIAVRVNLTLDGHLRLQVRDTGPGIPPEKMERLFVPFDRLGLTDSGMEGAGLGLALSKGLMEAMKGRIGAVSVVGEGSTFWLELPLVTDRLQEILMAEVEANLTEEMRKHQGVVLYVEDNLANVTLVEAIMARLPGVRLINAMQGRLALELAREHRPNLVLLDLHLPDISGTTVLENLRAEPRTQEIPVVVISADATPGQTKRLLALGARRYLAKPINVREFLEVIADALGETG